VKKKKGKIIQKEQKAHEKITDEQSEFLNKWLRFRNRRKKIVFEKPERTLFVA